MAQDRLIPMKEGLTENGAQGGRLEGDQVDVGRPRLRAGVRD